MNYESKIKKPKNKGYTIIETMIAVSVFVVVIAIGMDALLNVGVIHQKSQDMRSLMDSLSFVMEDVSKTLRTGSEYHCIDVGDTDFDSNDPHSCENGDGISFMSVDGDRFIYFLDPTELNIKRSINGGSFIPLTPSEIVMDSSSGFFVMGAELSDMGQPLATIRLAGEIVYKNTRTPFSLQTSVSQRLIEVP